MKTRKRLLQLGVALFTLAILSVAAIKVLGTRCLTASVERFEAEIGPLDPAAYAPAPVEEAENAAFWIKKGSGAVDLSDAQRAALADFLAGDSNLPSPELEEMLVSLAPAFDSLRRASDLTSSSWDIPYTLKLGVEAPGDLLDVLLAAKLLYVDARVGLGIGDLDRVLADAKALAGLQRAFENEPMLLFQLLTTTLEQTDYALLQDLVLSDLTNVDLLDQVAPLLHTERLGSSLSDSFALDAAWSGTLFDTATEMEPSWVGRIVFPFWAPFETAASVDLYYRLCKATELPATEIETFVREVDPAAPIARIIGDMLIPNLIHAIRKERAGQATQNLAHIAVDLRRHALMHGTYPESLGDFPLADLPDPFADGNIRFEHHADGSASLSYPEAEALWRKDDQHQPTFPPIFVWQLPRPVTPGSSAVVEDLT